MCDKYREPIEKVYPDVPVFEISLVEHAFFRVIQKWMERNLRSVIPEERHVGPSSQLI